MDRSDLFNTSTFQYRRHFKDSHDTEVSGPGTVTVIHTSNLFRYLIQKCDCGLSDSLCNFFIH